MHRAFWIFFMAAALALTPCAVSAHSKKGLKKIVLQSETLVWDQVAFYIEPMVNNRKDESGAMYRYQAWECLKIEHHDDLAEVHILVNDQKTATKSPEVVLLRRNPDNSWNHVDSQERVIAERIFTYVNPDGSISSGGHKSGAQTSGFGISPVTGGVACALLVVLLIIMRRRRKKAA